MFVPVFTMECSKNSGRLPGSASVLSMCGVI